MFQLLRHPDCHAVVLRRVGNTLRSSVYAQAAPEDGLLRVPNFFRSRKLVQLLKPGDAGIPKGRLWLTMRPGGCCISTMS